MPPYLRSAHPSKTVANVHIQGPPTKRKCDNDNNDNAKSDNDAPTISRWLTKRAKTEKVADSDDDSPSFASYFTSLPFMVLVGINKKRYYLHRSVLSRASPYFDKLLQFPGAEVHRNVVSLSTPVDTENAFNMFVDYCYHKDYKPAAAENTGNSILTHVEVYTFAERVCMTDLKETALNKLSQELRNSYTRAAGNSSSLKKGAKTSGTAPTVLTVSTISTEDVVMMVEKTYSHTPSPDSAMVNRNPLRTLVVRFCASCLSQLRVLPAFMELVRDFADFEDDLFREVKNGATLKAGKAAWLNWLIVYFFVGELPKFVTRSYKD